MAKEQGNSTKLRHQAGLRPAIEIHAEEPYLRLSTFQGPRIISTACEYIEYAYRLMEIRIIEWYDTASTEIKERWQKDTDALLYLSDKPILPSPEDPEAGVIKSLHEALNLQRNREEGSAHLTASSTLHVWMQAMEKAEQYLSRT